MIKKIDFVSRKGEWALVIGASTGLGAAWANECAKKGFNTIICARRIEKLQEVSANIRGKYRVETKEFVCDIGVEDAPDVIMKAIEGLDVAVCIYNAAVENAGIFIKMEEKYHHQLILGNVTNSMAVAYRIGRLMAKKHRGYLLLVSSMGGAVGTANCAVYSGCKAFMSVLGESLWYELSKYGVYAAGVTVGSVATPNYLAQQAAQGTEMEAGQGYQWPEFDFDITSLQPYLAAQAHTPEVVAEYVIQHIGEGPRLFTHPEDEAGYYSLMRTSRDIDASFMGMFTDLYFSKYTMFNALDADEFVETEK